MTGEAGDTRGYLVSGRVAELEDALCERVLELRAGGPLTPLTIVVGSAAVRTRIVDLLVRRLGAVANISVVTLARLAADLVAQARGAPPPVLAGMARERLVRRLVAPRRGRGLAYFGPVCERPHFAQALAATFADLREARIDPVTAWAEGSAAVSPADRARAADLQVLYAGYCDELGRRGLVDAAGSYLTAAALGGPVVAPTILYGIYDLNQAQEALVARLLEGGADVFVPVPSGGDGAGASALDAARAAGLLERRRDAQPPDDDLRRMAVVSRPAPIREAGRLRLRGDGTLRIVSVADERAETREAVRAMVTAVGAGAALWDCAVVAPHGDEVERLAAGLTEAGLPVSCRRPERSAGSRILGRLADCLAPPAGEPFARREVVDLLVASSLRGAEVAPRDAAQWLDEARRAGVVSGLAQWTERVARRRRGLERRVDELAARGQDAGGDDEAADDLEAAQARLGAARGLETAVETLARACEGLPARAAWGDWADALAFVAESLFVDPDAQAARDVAARLKALAVLREEVDVVEMAAALREQLASARLPVGRVGRDGVAVLTPLELRGLRFHTVVFTGLAEGGFPARGRPDPIFGDAERRRVNDDLGARLPLAESRDAESTLLFAFAAEAARDRLILIVPRSDAVTGRPRLPSRLVLRLASLAADRPVGLDEFLSGAPLATVWRHVGGLPRFADDTTTVWVDERERDTAALLALSASARRETGREYLAAVLDDPDAAARRLDLWRAARDPRPGVWDGVLGGEACAALAARHPFAAEMHPTRLERYVSCPFAFLLRDVFGLDAPEEPGDSLEMDGREFGTLTHEILQRTFETVIAGEATLAEAEIALRSAWESCSAEAERRGVTGAALAWNVRRAALLDDLLESLRRDPVFSSGGARPLAVEWRFGESVGRPVGMDLGGGTRVRFAGRLDRLDATPTGARVIDYKTGKGDTERRLLKNGLSVQLPVYQLAVRQTGGEEYSEIACLYRLVTRRGGFNDLPLPIDEAAATSRLRRLVAEAVALIDAGVFARSTTGRCESCDVGYACGVTGWTRGRKRLHPALGALVRLQTSGPEEVGDGAGA